MLAHFDGAGISGDHGPDFEQAEGEGSGIAPGLGRRIRANAVPSRVHRLLEAAPHGFSCSPRIASVAPGLLCIVGLRRAVEDSLYGPGNRCSRLAHSSVTLPEELSPTGRSTSRLTFLRSNIG